MKRYITVWIVAALLVLSTSGVTESRLPSVQAAKPEAENDIQDTIQDQKQSVFEQTIDHWIEQLSKQEGFETWKGAQWDSNSLGANMHTWHIEVTNGSKVVGYLMVGADAKGGYRLLEYGLGTYALFQFDSLNPFLEAFGYPDQTEGSWEKLYHGPFEAFWYINRNRYHESGLFDAKTGERYQVSEDTLRGMINLPEAEGLLRLGLKSESKFASESMSVKQEGMRASFDPFEHIPWVIKQPLKDNDPQSLLSKIKDQQTRITYTERIVNNHILLALAVCGAHLWSTSETSDQPLIYWAVDQEGLRFVPDIYMREKGSFYAS